MRKRDIVLCFVLVLVGCLAQVSECAKLHLLIGSFDPLEEQFPRANVAGLDVGEWATSYQIVQCSGPIKTEWKNVLADSGARILEYLPDFAFLVCVDPSEIEGIRGLPFVRWVGPYLPAYKIDPDLLESRRECDITVRMFPGGDVSALISALGSLPESASEGSQGYKVVRAHASPDAVVSLARQEGVAWIEKRSDLRLCNDVARSYMGVPETWQAAGLCGQGQVVAVCDTGLDTGNASTIHRDIRGRLSAAYARGRANDWSDPNGHGTHVCGSVLGNGTMSGGNPAIHNYTNSFAGAAPEAQLVMQSVMDSLGYLSGLGDHLGPVFQEAYSAGARIHSNSWGAAEAGKYKIESMEVDEFCWSHKDFLTLFAAGNEGVDDNRDGVIDQLSIGVPATAKDCISVGASENVRSSGGYSQASYGSLWSEFTVSPISGDLTANNANGMAAFSSRGPALDGRIKPELVAPGTNIISCRSQAAGAGTGWGVYDANYIYEGGTSMATPLAAGAAALVRQYYTQVKSQANPSSALIKATLINGATDMSPGQYGTGAAREIRPRPSFVDGWGRINVAYALATTDMRSMEYVDDAAGLTTSAAATHNYTVANGSVPLRVSLVWTDYPGSTTASKTLVNDLDLTVIGPGGVVYPGNGASDRINNVECVDILSPPVGVYIARVSGYSVPMDPQPYALVVSGGLPASVVSGTIRSDTGAAVTNVNVAVGTYAGLTDSDGRYGVRVAPGSYDVTPSKAGWTFAPTTRTVDVPATGVAGVDFTGAAGPGGISGQACLRQSSSVQSPHPYSSGANQTWAVSGVAGAGQVRVVFDYIRLENNWDHVYVMDSADNVIDTWTGDHEDVVSSWVPGSSLKIQLTSDGSVTDDGFIVTSVDSCVAGIVITEQPGGAQAATDTMGSYSLSNLPVGSHTLTPSHDQWAFDPRAREATVDAGAVTQGIDFIGHLPAGITGRITTSSISTTSSITESAHPYTNDYSNTWTISAASGAARTRLHFERIDTERGYDYVDVLNASGAQAASYNGQYDGFWGQWVTGDTVKVRLRTDGSVTKWGFKVDSYQYESSPVGKGGIAVTLTPAAGSTQTTAADGAFSFAGLPPGTYIIEPTDRAYTFDPVRRTVMIDGGTTTTGIDFRAFDPGAARGTVSQGQLQNVRQQTESAHPYSNDSSQSWTLTGAANTIALRLHFQSLDLESDYDFVYVRDAGGSTIDTYTGSQSDVWTDWVPGSSARIVLTSDGSVVKNGFMCDRYQSVTSSGAQSGVLLTAAPNSSSATTAADGSYALPELPAGANVITPALQGLDFIPESRSVVIASGQTTTAVDFCAVDTSGPAIALTAPSTSPSFARNWPVLNLSGTAADGNGVAGVTWSNESGASGVCTGDATWTATGIPLAAGDNHITIAAVDGLGNTGSTVITVTYLDAQPAAGWSGVGMVSLPIVPDVTDPQPVVGFRSTGWYAYDAAAKSYKRYPDQYTQFDPAASAPGRGFWAYFPPTGAAQPQGTIPNQAEPKTIHLFAEWNLIGQPFVAPVVWSLEAITVCEAQGSPKSLRQAGDVVCQYAWGWDNAQGSYYLVYDTSVVPAARGTLEPWAAYWIYAIRECDLTLPAP